MSTVCFELFLAGIGSQPKKLGAGLGLEAIIPGHHAVSHDVTQRKQLGGKRYQGVRADVRRMAHRFADQIMLFLTGEEGPFNSQIAFVSNRADGRAKEVYRMDVSGTAVSRVTRDRTLSLGPSWSPAGEELLFISYKRGGPYPYRLNLASGKAINSASKINPIWE